MPCPTRLPQMEHALEKLNPDMRAIEEYREKEADYRARAADAEALTAERDEVRGWVGRGGAGAHEHVQVKLDGWMDG
eukprot:361311-Chlamydomonas_euryale.AAC.3